MTSVDPRRRRLCLGIGAALAAGLAGCSDDSADDGGGETADSPAEADPQDGTDGETANDDASDSTDSTADDEEGSTDDDDESANGDSDASTDDGAADGDGDASTDDEDGTADDGGDESTDGDEDSTGALDLREANVVSVTYEADGEEYRFTVGLHHDDDGEDGYANWWQVERLDGTQLGRRDLLHAHSRQPFERSASMTVPPEVSCVVVRGHDQTHGYGGRAMLVNLDSGATRTVEQGSEPDSFDDGDCP